MRIRRTHVTVMLISAVILLLPIVLHIPNPYGNPVVQEVHETSHTVLFFFAQLVLLVIGRRRRPEWPLWWIMLGTALLATTIGGLIEVVQPYFKRSRSWDDLGRDVLGIAAACGVFYGVHVKRRACQTVAFGLTTAVLVVAFMPLAKTWQRQWLREQAFPLLTNFDSAAMRYNVGRTEYARIRFVNAPEPWQSNRSTVLEVLMPKDTRWSGFALYHPVPHWRNYRYFAFEVFSPSTKATRIAVNIYSVESGSKVVRYQAFDIEPGLNQLAIDLTRDGPLHGQYINRVLWYSIAPERDVTLFFDNIVLR
jgi:VanZ family protein